MLLLQWLRVVRPGILRGVFSVFFVENRFHHRF